MIYLTFDTNIWLYTLDESWKIENHLDHLEQWVSEGYIKLLLPEIIFDEWKRNRENGVKEREKMLKNFFDMADEILPTAFFLEYKDQRVLNALIADQFSRIESLLNSCEIIPLTGDIQKKVLVWGIEKKAPMHGKSSVADAIIVLSLIDFAANNPEHQYFFLSNNTTDFFERGRIHPDLAPLFEQNGIRAFRYLNYLINELKSVNSLPTSPEIETKRKSRIKNKIRETIYNPEYEQAASSEESPFILNLNTLDFILKEHKPTREQVIFVLALIDSDNSYQSEFYKRVQSKNWFRVLKNRNAFHEKNNPSPVVVEKGLSIRFWEPLQYLEKISLQIKEGRNQELIDEILLIVRSISNNPRDNYQTWRFLINILTNIPNNKIPVDIFQYIPIWLDSTFDTMYQSFPLCEELFPKFLPESPTPDDIKKAEAILIQLFTVHGKEDNQFYQGSADSKNFRSRLYISILETVLIKNELVSKVATVCSTEIIMVLASNLNKLLFNFNNDWLLFKFNSNGLDFESKFELIDDLLKVTVVSEASPDLGTISINVQLLSEMTVNELTENLLEQLEKKNIPSQAIATNPRFGHIIYAVLNGTYVSLKNSISEFQSPSQDGEEAAFQLIFRDLLNEYIVQRPEDGLALLELIAFDSRFRHFFYRKVALFLIGKHWIVGKSIFFRLTSEVDNWGLFSDHKYKAEIYSLLYENQSLFEQSDLLFLQEIFEKGPKNEITNEDSDHWRLRWYSALRNTELFQKPFETLSIKLNLGHEAFEKEDNVISWGNTTSGFTVNELYEMSNKEIATYLLNFKPQNSWEEPSLAGIANLLNTAVTERPEKFSSGLADFVGINYIHAYRMLNGFRDAWSKSKLFDWLDVLTFCKAYLLDARFYSEQLSSKSDSWHATSEWVVGAISELLSEGMQSDRNSFDLDLLPTAKEILQTLSSNLQTSDYFKRSNSDYITYTLNSTAGKVLKALLDYSLRRARNLNPEIELQRWEDEIKNLYEEVLNRDFVDGYVSLGLYFQQFFYLDKEWSVAKIQKVSDSEGNEWIPLMAGYSFRNPSNNLETFRLFRRLYEKLIRHNAKFDFDQRRGIIGHLATYYFWEFESLENNSLLMLFLECSTSSDLSNLVTFIWQQKEYHKFLEARQQIEFEEKIFSLWDQIVRKYENSIIESDIKVVVHSCNLIEFVSELNETNSTLISKCLKRDNGLFSPRNLFSNLIRLKNKGEQSESSNYLAIVMDSIPINTYFATSDKPTVIELVTSLYENGKKTIADGFCNRFVRQGHDFLQEIYLKYQNE